jgi:hypothetical protein
MEAMQAAQRCPVTRAFQSGRQLFAQLIAKLDFVDFDAHEQQGDHKWTQHVSQEAEDPDAARRRMISGLTTFGMCGPGLQHARAKELEKTCLTVLTVRHGLTEMC